MNNREMGEGCLLQVMENRFHDRLLRRWQQGWIGCNVQGQQQFVWPPSFALARAYLDQLERSNGLAADRITSTRQALDAAERASGQERSQALSALASELHAAADGAGDSAKADMLATAVEELAKA